MLVVGRKEELYRSAIVVEKFNYLSIASLSTGESVGIKIRYRSPEAPARLEQVEASSLRALFDDPQPAITPGQAAVFYRGDLVLGGGIIRGSG